MSDHVPPFTVRRLHPDDRAAWEPLWAKYLAFYRAELPAPVSDATFDRLCAQDGELVGLVGLDAAGTALGLGHLVLHASTWATAPSCYLQDLFVDPRARGSDLSLRLFDAIYAAAAQRGATSVYWHTQQYNGRARSLYDQVGELTSFIVYSHDLPAAGDAPRARRTA